MPSISRFSSSAKFLARAALANVRAAAWVTVLAPFVSACAIIPYATSTNTKSTNQAGVTRATDQIAYEELDRGVFVGIAMSGGGSRAANFSAAVLIELEKQGLLEHTSAVSSVSGSSVTAAYYAMFNRRGARDPNKWNESEIRRRLGYDMQGEWIRRWLLPQNVIFYWLSDFDRSDIMKRVFESTLFDGHQKRFADFGTGTPKILLNATTMSGENFTFTDRAFARIQSDLPSFRVAEAIMASAAFPGVFHNVTLRDFTQEKRFVHLFDGGPSDNLGVEALQRLVKSLLKPQGPRLRGCMLFVVDSFVDTAALREQAQAARSDTRGLIGLIVGDNVGDAFDALLAHRRQDALVDLGFAADDGFGTTPISSYVPQQGALDASGKPLICHVWHISFQRLAKLNPEAAALARIVNNIDTRFRLEGPLLIPDDGATDLLAANAPKLQDKLYQAAKILVEADTQAVEDVRRLFEGWFGPGK